MLTLIMLNFDYWFNSVDRCIKHLYEEMHTLFSGKKIRLPTFDLLAIEPKKLRINMLPKRVFFHLFFCKRSSRTAGKCHICTRLFAFDDGFAHEVSTTTFITFRDFLMVEQIFFSPQVKRSVIISNKYGIYEFPHELPNDLRLRIAES